MANNLDLLDSLPTCLGFDFSTQQIKAVIVDAAQRCLQSCHVSFDVDLPEFGTEGGVRRHSDGLEVTAPVLMWVKGLDILMERMQAAGVQFDRIAAISGSGQHGTVFWRCGGEKLLRNLDHSKPLCEQLQDSSTEHFCQKLESAVGGGLNLAKLTGSRAYHRFSGNQIAKIYANDPDVYAGTEKVSLVSSFACSLFLGAYANIDFSDGSGMNLLNIETKSWEPDLLNACAPGLGEKLGIPVPSCTISGTISGYFVSRYGFREDAKVVTFTGDNPASVVGINLQKGDVAVSLGTSDTVLVWLDTPKASLAMHVLCNPLDEHAYLGMLCFKNGSLTRERIKTKVGCKDWSDFNDLVRSTVDGNDGCIGFYFDAPEILPHVAAGDWRFDSSGRQVCSFDDAVEARGVIESQCLAKKVHALELGCNFDDASHGKIIVTGGAATNEVIQQTLANVFNRKVYIQEIQNSAAVGAAIIAKKAIVCGPAQFANIQHHEELKLVAVPAEDKVQIYKRLEHQFKQLETQLSG